MNELGIIKKKNPKMAENKFQFKIQTTNNGELDIILEEGNALFVLGANGVGKSTLMYSLYRQNINHSKRILAHRRTWFTNNSMDMTASQKKDYSKNIKQKDNQIYSRWKDDYAQQRSSISIFDLINSENIRAREIAFEVDKNDLQQAKALSSKQAPIQAINEILSISNIPIEISLGKDEQLFASKNGSEPYSIAELSDGERNALLICADVLTTDSNHLIILDEPERHLHRSIISPLLTSLFEKRKDCVFVISTHDVLLPIDHSESTVLLLRDCNWEGKNIKSWDADLIGLEDSIPEDVRKEIFGAKRELLFVEGINTSLDKQIYSLLYPKISVISYGSCSKVEKAVEGIKGTGNLHWVKAYGLIDADDRTEEQIQNLLTKGVAAVDCYSVESIYYNIEIIRRVTERYSGITGENPEDLFQKAIAGIKAKILPHKERLCSRLCEKRVRTKIMSQLPKHTDILGRGDFNLSISLKDEIEKEEEVFDKYIAENNLNGLISRYPIRETPVIKGIVDGIGIKKDKYENIVRKLVIDDSDTREYLKNGILSNLTNLIEEE